nr:Lactate malate dehydrogenase domain containing protein [Haemonchus contortus]
MFSLLSPLIIRLSFCFPWLVVLSSASWSCRLNIMSPLRVLVTGAAGQIGYSLVLQIAKGDVFGKETPIVLVLLDIPPMATALEGVQYELQDCALANLKGVECVTTEKEAFTDIDYAFLVGAMPRKEGMERKDLLAANVKIFKSQGKALADFAKATTKVIVVGNPANTNAFICAKYAAPKIPARNFSAMTRLDHNRATAQLAMKAGVGIGDVKNVIIWGNHSSTQFPDVKHATVTKGGQAVDAYSAVNDMEFLHGPFISTIQKRGAVIIQKRKLSSAMSAAKAACDHIHDWHFGTKPGEWVSMAVPSDGSYGIPNGLMFSFPVTIDGATKEWKIVQGLSLDDFAKGKLAETQKELEEERDEALKACDAASM